MLAANPDDIARGLQTIHGKMPSGLYLTTWTMPDKTSRWYTSADAAIAEAQRLANDPTLAAFYMGVSWSPADYGPRRRLKADDAGGYPALWADIDILGPGHKKPNLPPDPIQAQEWLRGIAPEPSVWVWSGHGWQPYWSLAVPWVITDDAERARAKRFAEGWNDYLRAHADRQGWDIDAVHDLSRVMRVPGTINRKEGEEAVLSVYHPGSGLEYPKAVFVDCIAEIEDIRRTKFAVTTKATAKPVPTATVGQIEVRSGGLQVDKWEELKGIDPKIGNIFEHKYPGQRDKSPSGWDHSLAIQAAQARWSDQEICDLLISHRKKWGEDLKVPGYFATTIANAREFINRDRAQDEISAAAAVLAQPGAIVTTDDRAGMLEHISRLVGMQVEAIIKMAEDPAQYYVQVAGGHKLLIGDADKLMNQKTWRRLVADTVKIVMNDLSKSAWRGVCGVMLMIAEELTVDRESTVEGQAESWLDAYISAREIGHDRAEAIKEYAPYQADEGVYISGKSLRAFVNTTFNERITAKYMGNALRLIGCTPVTVFHTENGRQTTRGVWLIPKDKLEVR